MDTVRVKELPYFKFATDVVEKEKSLDEFIGIFPKQILEDTYKELVNRYDKFLLEQFEKAGYSFEDVIELVNEKRLRGFSAGTRTEFYLDGEFLLSFDKFFKPFYKNMDECFCFEKRVICTFADGTTAIMTD